MSTEFALLLRVQIGALREEGMIYLLQYLLNFYFFAVNKYHLILSIVVDKKGILCQTGVLEVVLDGMRMNMRHFPRRLPHQTRTPVANGSSTYIYTLPVNGGTPSRQTQQ